jgi:hypothetical protein
MKPKIFVRYRPGASGNFIAMLLTILYQGLPDRQDWSSMHQDPSGFDRIYGSHNFKNQALDSEFFERTAYRGVRPDTVAWMQNQYKFYPTQDPIYVIPTHAMNPNSLLTAWNCTKIINILVQPADYDQIAYNFVTKYVVPDPLHTGFAGVLAEAQTQAPGMLDHVDVETFDWDNVQLACQIYRTAWRQDNDRFNNMPVAGPSFDINFNEIFTGSIGNRLDALINFVEIQVNSNNRTGGLTAISKYAGMQIKCPWKLNNFDDLGVDRS